MKQPRTLLLRTQLAAGAAFVCVAFLVVALLLLGHAAGLRDTVEDARITALEALPADGSADGAEIALGQLSVAAHHSHRTARLATIAGLVAVCVGAATLATVVSRGVAARVGTGSAGLAGWARPATDGADRTEEADARRPRTAGRPGR